VGFDLEHRIMTDAHAFAADVMRRYRVRPEAAA